MKAEVHTLRFGEAEWLTECAPSLESWCQKHRYQFCKWGKPKKAATPKLAVLDMLDFFIKGKNDIFIYMDADVLLHPAAPEFPAAKGITLATDSWHQEHNPHFREWATRHCGPSDKYREWQYSNAGVWSIDKPSAIALLATMKKVKFVEFFQEQHWFNACVVLSGVTTNQLGSEWNRYGREQEPSWAFHLWGETKMEDLTALRHTGVLDRLPTKAKREGLVTRLQAPGSGGQSKTVVLEFIQDGGLGNQMFEWAAGFSIAKRLNLPFRWVWKPSKLREFGLRTYGIGEGDPVKYKLLMSRAGQGSRRLYEVAVKRIAESQEQFCGISCPFQDEKCFIDHADDITDWFRTSAELPNPEGTTPIGVQVRRGDYLKHSRLNVTTPDYFTNAMRWMREEVPNAHFIVVSDDPEWCRKFFGYREDTTVMPPQDPEEGIATLAECKGHIISNSTFGWWGAWLGERKHGGPVVVPELWHHGGKSYGEWNPVPERWHRVGLGAYRRRADIEAQNIILDPDLPNHERAIVYPYHADQETWHELRYSLRSVEKFFEDKDCPIYILGTRKPGWLIESHRVRYLGAYTYREALSKGVQLAEQVLWMNDDIVLLRPTSWEDCRTTLYLKEVGPDFLERAQTQANPWREGCVKVLRALAGEGIRDQKVFSTHTPYVYRRKEAMEILQKYGAWEKFPMELAYFHHHAVNPTLITTERAMGLPFGEARFLNHSDRTLDNTLKQTLAGMFTERPPWEMAVNFGL